MSGNRSLEIAIEEAIGFVRDTYPNCLFSEDEITNVIRAAFAARRRDGEARADFYSAIGRTIDNAVGRRQAAIEGESR